MNVVVGDVAGDHQADRRDMQNGRVVGVRMSDLHGDQVVPFEIDHISFELISDHEPVSDLARKPRAPEVRNDVHLLLSESNAHARREWIAALDTIEALHPRAVIAGHKRPETDDAPRIIEETRQYIRDFDRLVQTTTTTRELYDQMLSLYPERVNPGALWSSARAFKPEEGKTA